MKITKIQFLKDSEELCGSSYFGLHISATTDALIQLFGEPDRSGDDIARSWKLELVIKEGNSIIFIPFELYTWMLSPSIQDDCLISFNIGCHQPEHADLIKETITGEIQKLSPNV